MTEAWGIHRYAMRARTIGANDRAPRSIIDPMHMRTAVEDREADLTACLAREHTVGRATPCAHTVAPRAAPVAKNAMYLDEDSATPLWGDAKAAGAEGLSGEDHKGERYG